MKGWHLPTKEDFEELLDNADFETLTDKDGFNALPIGYRDYHGNFSKLGEGAYFWSATADDGDFAYYLYLDYIYENTNVNNYYKFDGQSVRLIKD